MKNKTFFALLLLMTTIVSLVGCKKKTPEEPAPIANCETTYQFLFGDATSTNERTSAVYENGQLKALESSSFNFSYEYAQDKINITAAGKPYYRIDIASSLATRLTDLTNSTEQRFSYDGSRNLIKIEFYFNGGLVDTKVLSYSNGNLSTVTQTFTGTPGAKRVTTYSYFPETAGRVDTETRHLVFGDADPTIPLFLLGTASSNVLKESHYTNTSDNFRSDVVKVYTYTRGSNNIANRIVENSHTVTVGNGIQTQDETFKRTVLVNSTCN
ncbi:hypothetical protein ACFOG5_00210 [Pedobacter fastidiosus]|uniref:YD repeat-containing protein n=1 Tax=Pedobacter fastidiosus TaxID=2765361 RepID=A0ABR7KZD2_9SPHI|nr:hypothetical protein [Pedobacter fastidiosus]MBC6113180.1 hypothetical protein [Pedobacter fastidiosus]